MKRSLFAFALLASAPRIADAQTSVSQSLPQNVRTELGRAHFRTGMQYYALNRFSEAAVEFERVYEFTGQSDILYNIARAHDAAGQFTRAAEAYDRYLATLATEDSARVNRQDIERLRDRAREQAARSARPQAAAARCVPLETGTASTSDGNAATTSGAETSSPDTSVGSTSAARAPRSAAPPLLQLRTQVVFERSAFNEVGPWVTLSAGAIVAGFGAWQTTVAVGQRALVAQANAGDRAGWTADVDRANSEFPTSSALGWGLSIGGGVALTAGITWLLARGRGVRREVIIAAAPQFNGGSLVIGARF